MSIAFISSDFLVSNNVLIPGGCGYYRCALPMTVTGIRGHLGRMAWDPTRGFGIRDSERTGLFGFERVMLKLIMDRWTPKQIELAKDIGQKIYVDVDDYHKGLTPANAAYHQTSPEANKRSNWNNYEKVIEAANYVTVSTPFLYDYYSQKRDNVFLIRNGINTRQFTPRKHQRRKPVIGWAGSTNYRNNDLEEVAGWLPKFMEKHDLMFHHAGHSDDAPPIADVIGIDPRRVTTSPLVPINRYAEGFKFDIGIVPLSDIDFNKAKSNIKGLEYAAAGIPFVASDLPEYRLLAEDGVGFLANSLETWEQQMTVLLDYDQRAKYARLARNVTLQRWSVEAMADEWRTVFSL